MSKGLWAKRFIGATSIVLTIVLIGCATWAYAAPALCGDRAKLIEGLAKRYQEVPVALGISQKNTQALEIFASKAGTWTAIMTMPTGIACIMAAGHSWHDIPRPTTKS